jgi:hypothetical protein
MERKPLTLLLTFLIARSIRLVFEEVEAEEAEEEDISD